MNNALRLTAVLATALAAGCVTINIYFPASAAEKAADSIIDEVWKTQKASQAADPAKEKTP